MREQFAQLGRIAFRKSIIENFTHFFDQRIFHRIRMRDGDHAPLHR